MKKILSLILLISFLSFSIGYTYADTFNVLPANTPITIQTINSYSSDTIKTGDIIKFNVVKNITSNGTVVISTGSNVYATVTKAKARSRIGKPGEIVVGDFYTISTNGTKIPLTGVISKKAKSKMGLSITLSAVVIPFFLLMHGRDVQIEQGSQYTVFTSSDINL